MQESAKTRPSMTDATREKLSNVGVGRLFSKESRQKQSDAHKTRLPATEETCQKMRESHTGVPFTEVRKQNLREAAKNRLPITDETRQRQSESSVVMWQRPEYVQAQMRATHVVQNKVELAAAEWLEPLGFQFVGDGQLIVAGKCPDFWDGRTKLIELYGDYWHRGQDPQDRIDLFKAAGYGCLVIWESELEDLDEVIECVNVFMERNAD